MDVNVSHFLCSNSWTSLCSNGGGGHQETCGAEMGTPQKPRWKTHNQVSLETAVKLAWIAMKQCTLSINVPNRDIQGNNAMKQQITTI